MIHKRRLTKWSFALVVTLFAIGIFSRSFGEAETIYYSDRFLFRGKDLNEMVLVLLNFNRGKEGHKYTGEFIGAIFYKGRWSSLEGNNRYPYLPKDLQVIQPSYFAKAEGAPLSGFKLRYDGGDFTINLSSGPVQTFYTLSPGPRLKSSVGVAEAVLTLRGKEYWGELIHEPLVWNGFNRLGIKYKGLFKEYQRFYLTTERGREIYFHQNKADSKAFRNRYKLSDFPQAEAGLIRSNEKSVYLFKPPIPMAPLGTVRPPFAFYTIPQRWKVEVPSVGTLYLWSRETASENWFWGGYYLMTIEGILKTGAQEERVWGMAEYIP